MQIMKELKMFFSRLLLAAVASLCFSTLAFGAALPHDEVQALRNIANTSGKHDWKSTDPCDELDITCTSPDSRDINKRSSCSGGLCSSPYPTRPSERHVVSIDVMGQNLTGTLPKDLNHLPYLETFDVGRNYLNGSIPPEWGSTNLVTISLYSNRLTGWIPKELGNISSLEYLDLESNNFSGPLPSELGNLSRLETLSISSNFFSGKLPPTFEKLWALKEFRIADNQFNGNIPIFVRNWTNLTTLDMQAAGLSGPIPEDIALLEYMEDLRISDLNGPKSPFPNVSQMTYMETLVLRKCNIDDELPTYLWSLQNLETLDLSFNGLFGQLPESNSELSSITDAFLTGNLLSGNVPDWMHNDITFFDLSYTNMTINNENFTEESCRKNTVNLFASPTSDKSNGTATCLRNNRCKKLYSSLHINCGGPEVTLNGTKYETDSTRANPSACLASSTNWMLSSTGLFLDDRRPKKVYTAGNSSRLDMENSELYMNARLSPISLTYYAYCLMNGSYNVTLHFAEIVFTDDSLGRRLFDVYIQGDRELKDFNITKAAGGVRKHVIKPFEVNVTHGTLEIRLYWAGKGTRNIPAPGTYGPLISAISVNPKFQLPSETMPAGAIAGIVIAVASIVVVLFSLLWYKGWLGRKDIIDEEFKGLHLQVGSFSLKQIKAATDNFSEGNKIGEGGFGPVYKGILPDGNIIAIKKLSSRSRQGTREFVTEIGMISALQHPHLVKLFGCCVEGNQLSLIYEYMENNSLAHVLFGTKEHQLHLDWPTRLRISIGIAKGLAYLHEESMVKIVHRDIKATNVLLDANLNPKISDFGLAKLNDEESTHISTRVAGTYGYMAPEYAMHGHLTNKADVYSFGVVLLEIVSGRSNTICKLKEEYFHLLEWVRVLKEKENIIEMVDSRLDSNFDIEQVKVMINVALLCTSVSPVDRPAMSTVVSMLEGKVALGEVTLDSVVSNDEMKRLRKKYNLILRDSSLSSNHSDSVSTNAPSIASSSTASDRCPVKSDQT